LGPLTIHLFAEDPDPGSGVSRTLYSIDSQEPLQYVAEGFQALAGEHLYTYWSLDIAGNQENQKHTMIATIPENAIPILTTIILTIILLHQLLPSPRQRPIIIR
jgi:hypothetical protein